MTMSKKPIIKEYKEFTPEERAKTQEVWVEHLYRFCKPVSEEVGMPCDLGVQCDRCHYDYHTQQGYAKDLVERGLPITPRQAKYLEEES